MVAPNQGQKMHKSKALTIVNGSLLKTKYVGDNLTSKTTTLNKFLVVEYVLFSMFLAHVFKLILMLAKLPENPAEIGILLSESNGKSKGIDIPPPSNPCIIWDLVLKLYSLISRGAPKPIHTVSSPVILKKTA
ncbi:hypothetical protein VP01_851g2 [Puccinia sorghi]|uniref:Uncharacterized protein n=1 Tax=Puccinia sorghi TaxID=27349 RepID=A0A0L6U939_9BASI|nr:hypothetical protein VP01_851g2 [Puccinia sorghi]